MDDPNSLLLLSLSDSDSEPDSAAAPTTPAATRADRTALSEQAFQALKQTYRPKLENGEVSTPPFPHNPS
ncbi:hypothetical protein BT67DRAFT_438170 [Trichocladium antarcticum]|uniref:Uncharacterized protein n=1 Tax=Trichocladium antarcticum TaxID=1450529 RepID=A0AAN6ZIJ6_9PEZI|nr:hypothetical protein BT67DRAFT_438170 [Trichocladium antarcticum]